MEWGNMVWTYLYEHEEVPYIGEVVWSVDGSERAKAEVRNMKPSPSGGTLIKMWIDWDTQEDFD